MNLNNLNVILRMQVLFLFLYKNFFFVLFDRFFEFFGIGMLRSLYISQVDVMVIDFDELLEMEVDKEKGIFRFSVYYYFMLKDVCFFQFVDYCYM